ncbi:MAG: hypothetical protein LWX07_00605 [Bacteroidetes bacterium]|nr:hypothetical protein [Bacteroidota bacterium]
MNDIGVVEYSRDTVNKRIIADWYYMKEGEKISGTGIVKGVPTDGYTGDYIVTYYDRNGKELSGFNLKITKTETCYELTWISGGKIIYYGLSMEKNGRLYAGWRSR